MVTTVNSYRRNSQTGKLEKTGNSRVLGNVAQSGGGYKTGTVATQNAQGQTITQLPQNNSVQSLSGPVYGTTAQNIPQGTANTSTPQGAVFTPPQSAMTSQAQPLPATDGSLSSSPAPMQGEQTPSREQLLAQGFGPNDFSLPGETQNFGEGVESGAAAPITGEDLLAFYGFGGIARKVVTGLRDIATLGMLASTTGGLETMAVAASGPAAQGVVKEVAKGAGKVAVNPATTAQLITLAKQAGLTTIGLGTVISLIRASTGSKQKSSDELVELAKTSGKLINDLQRSQDPELQQQAASMVAQFKETRDAVESFSAYVPFGLGKVDDKLREFKTEVDSVLLSYENAVQDQTGEAILEQLGNNPDQEEVDAAKTFIGGLPTGPLKTKLQKALNEGQESADTIAAGEASRAAENQRIFQERQQKDQQKFQREERLAREAYETQTRDAANTQKQFDEDTQITSSEGGTLTFGLLGGGGATEFVSADRAAQAYFGKVYEELSPEQKRLLNLLKGGN